MSCEDINAAWKLLTLAIPKGVRPTTSAMNRLLLEFSRIDREDLLDNAVGIMRKGDIRFDEYTYGLPSDLANFFS